MISFKSILVVLVLLVVAWQFGLKPSVSSRPEPVKAEPPKTESLPESASLLPPTKPLSTSTSLLQPAELVGYKSAPLKRSVDRVKEANANRNQKIEAAGKAGH